MKFNNKETIENRNLSLYEKATILIRAYASNELDLESFKAFAMDICGLAMQHHEDMSKIPKIPDSKLFKFAEWIANKDEKSITPSCSVDFPAIPEQNRFIGCDGEILSDELLDLQLESALKREDYEDAAVLRDELKRRKLTQ